MSDFPFISNADFIARSYYTLGFRDGRQIVLSSISAKMGDKELTNEELGALVREWALDQLS